MGMDGPAPIALPVDIQSNHQRTWGEMKDRTDRL